MFANARRKAEEAKAALEERAAEAKVALEAKAAEAEAYAVARAREYAAKQPEPEPEPEAEPEVRLIPPTDPSAPGESGSPESAPAGESEPALLAGILTPVASMPAPEPEPREKVPQPDHKLSRFERARQHAAALVEEKRVAAEEALRAKVGDALVTRDAREQALSEAKAGLTIDPQRFPGSPMSGWMDKDCGRFSGWQPMLFVVTCDSDLLAFDNRAGAEGGEPVLRLPVSTLSIRNVSGKLRERQNVLRIDSADQVVEQLVLDPGSATARDDWILALGNMGAVVPAEYISQLEASADPAAGDRVIPRSRRVKKGWLDIQVPLAQRAVMGSLAEWQSVWLEFEVPTLTVHLRPGSEAIAKVAMDQLELLVGPAVEAELSRDHAFRMALRSTWSGAAANAKKMFDSLPFTGLATETQLECDLWVQALSTRTVTLHATQADGYGMKLDQNAVVEQLLMEPDGLPGPAELAQIRRLQRIRSVNGAAVGSGQEARELFHDETGSSLLHSVELTVEGVGLPARLEDETEEAYTERLLAEDEDRMRKEIADEEGLAQRAAAELEARMSAEAQAAEEREREEIERKMLEQAEQQNYIHRVSEIVPCLSGKDVDRVKFMLQSDHSRRLYCEGLLSKSNDEAKRLKLVKNIGHSYFMLFSDMLLFLQRDLKNKGYVYKIEQVIEMSQLRDVQLASHAYDAQACERRGFTVAPLHLDRSSATPREFPYRVYAAHVAAQEKWVKAFKRVLLSEREREQQSESSFGAHHQLCQGTVFAAAMQGDLLLVERALRLDPSCAAAQDEYGVTALMLAARYGFDDIVLSLASRGNTPVNASDHRGRTAAHLAAEGGHCSVLKVLGDHNANFNKGDHDDRVPLDILIGKGGVSMTAAKSVVSSGGVVDRIDRWGRSGLHNAVADGAVAVIEQWIQLGANVDKPVVDKTRTKPLLLAAENIADQQLCATVVRTLLSAGAHPDKPGNSSGASVLQVLIDKGKISAAAACVRNGAKLNGITGLTSEQHADFKSLSSKYSSEQRKARAKHYAGRAAAAVAGFVEEQEVEPTIVRRNYMLTLREGNVDEALAMVSFRGLLTDHLPNLTASAVPFVGVAYGVLQPIWTQMRDVCLIAALYGHDIEGDPEVKSKILECVTGDIAEKSAGNGASMSQKVKDMMVKKSINKLGKKISQNLAARQASAFAIASGPVAPVLNYIYRSATDTELAESHSFAIKFFGENAPGVPPEEYLVEIPATSRFYSMGRSLDRAEQMTRETGAKFGEAIDNRFGVSDKAEKAGLVVWSGAASAASKLDSVLGIKDRINKGLAAATEKKTEMLDKAHIAGVEKLTGVAEQAIDRVSDGMIEKLDNTLDLPKFMDRMIKELITDISTDLKNESQFTVELMLGLVEEEDQEGDDMSTVQQPLSGFQKFRAYILYAWNPYDHRIGYMYSNPVYIALKLIGMCPYGVNFCFYSLMFYMIDRSNNYQLVKVIIDFKALQALSMGIGAVFLGAAYYIRCANAEPLPTCEKNGPGMTSTFFLSWIGWVGCVLLSWISYFMLHQRTKGDPASGKGAEYNMKSRLTVLITYDVIVFTTCLGLTALSAAFDVSFWLYAFWCKCLYGVFALPWIPLALPMVDELIAHSRATGYNVRGQCKVKKFQDNETKEENNARDRKTLFSRAVESDTVLADILDDMLAVAIKGGQLPIHDWSSQLAPIFKESADVIAAKKGKIQTAAEQRGGGLTAWKEGAIDVARDEAATQSKVLLAKNANELARQGVIMLNAALEMPKFISEAVEDIMLSFVPDVTEELHEGIDKWLVTRGSVRFTQPNASQEVPTRRSNCYEWLSGLILHTWMPYDNQPRKVKCCHIPWSRLFGFFACNSLMGFNYVVSFVIFCLMDKTDEYQLVKFILRFKGFQFFSTGLLLAIVGVITYMTCVPVRPEEVADAQFACQHSLIAIWPIFYPLIACWLLSVLLVWVSFAKLLGRHRKSLKSLDPVSAQDAAMMDSTLEANRQLHRERAHKLLARTKFWFKYDVCTMCVCVAIAGAVIGVRQALGLHAKSDAEFDWELRQLVYWTKVLYSMLSLPFVLFTLPLFHLCFTSAEATGYDIRGKCMPLQKLINAADSSVSERVSGTFDDELGTDTSAMDIPGCSDANQSKYAPSLLPSVPAAINEFPFRDENLALSC